MRHLNDKLLKGSNLYNLINNINQRFPDMIIYGKSTQDKTTGANILQMANYNKTDFGVDVSCENNLFVLNGTLTNPPDYARVASLLTKITFNYPNYDGSHDYLTLQPGKYIANFIEISGTYTSSPKLSFVAGTTSPKSFLIRAIPVNSSASFTLTEETIVRCNIQYTGTFDNYKCRVTLTKTDTPTIEPYTNGPAPNPDYPMPIVNKKIGNIELCSIDDSKDYIKGKPGEWKLYKKIRKIELPISEMNNLENYPGWKNIDAIKKDYLDNAIPLGTNRDYLTNIRLKDNYSLYIDNRKQYGIIYLNKDYFKLSQSEWKEQYLNLIFVIQYVLLDYESIKITDKATIEILNSMYLEKIKENQQDIVID